MASQQTQQTYPMFDQCWANVVDGGPTLVKHHRCVMFAGFDKAAGGLDEGSDVDVFFFERINTEKNLFLYVNTPAANML